jgi:hypothetical protein
MRDRQDEMRDGRSEPRVKEKKVEIKKERDCT